MATAESSKEELLELLRQAKLQVGISGQSTEAVMPCRIDTTAVAGMVLGFRSNWTRSCDAANVSIRRRNTDNPGQPPSPPHPAPPPQPVRLDAARPAHVALVPARRRRSVGERPAIKRI